MKKKIKKVFWILTNLLIALSIRNGYGKEEIKKENSFQKSYQSGYGLEKGQLMQAYNASGRIEVLHDLKFFTGTNFLYLDAYQEGMQLAEKTRLENGIRSIRKVIVQEFKWNPAFKLNFGWAMDRDSWNFYAEYFYFYISNTTKSSASLWNNEYFNMSTLYGSSINNSSYALTGVYVNSEWKIDGNFLDFNLTRPFYNSKKNS